MIIGESKRLILRTFTKEDIDDVMAFWGSSEVMRFCPGSICDKEVIEKALRKYTELQSEKGHSVYAVELKENKKVIGGCGFNTTEEEDIIELIYHFSKEYWGNGYALEAGKLALLCMRTNGRFRKVIASISPENQASLNVLKKLEFNFVEMKWFEDSQCFEPCYEYKLDDDMEQEGSGFGMSNGEI